MNMYILQGTAHIDVLLLYCSTVLSLGHEPIQNQSINYCLLNHENKLTDMLNIGIRVLGVHCLTVNIINSFEEPTKYCHDYRNYRSRM